MKKKVYKNIELVIDSIGFKGISVTRNEGVVYFVKGGVPGDKVEARILRKKKSYYEAVVENLIEPSINRVTPVCNYFGTCGGCSWQHLNYEQQLFWKRQHVIDAFERIGKIPVGDFEAVLPSPKQFGYRNKMEFSFGASRWLTQNEIQSGDDNLDKNFALGLHVPGRFDKVIDIDECHIHYPLCNVIINLIRKKAIEFGTKAYDSRNQEGFLKNLIFRRSEANNQLMAILITSAIKNDESQNFINWYENDFKNYFTGLTDIAHGINDTLSPVFYGNVNIIKGDGFITEQITGLDYRISPFAFFQTNSFQLDNFINEILNKAQLNSGNIVWDFYCGAGSITLPASRKCKSIYGVELFEESVKNAKVNANLNKITNAEFYCYDLHNKQLSEFLLTLPKPDVLIIDPPRAGMHQNLINSILDVAPVKIVYVSCNPTTQARDCELLKEKYDVVSVKPVDMFPHTFHIESIALLGKKE